jgi:hypothetical protein
MRPKSVSLVVAIFVYAEKVECAGEIRCGQRPVPDLRVGVAERRECWALAVVVADPLVDV